MDETPLQTLWRFLRTCFGLFVLTIIFEGASSGTEAWQIHWDSSRRWATLFFLGLSYWFGRQIALREAQERHHKDLIRIAEDRKKEEQRVASGE